MWINLTLFETKGSITPLSLRFYCCWEQIGLGNNPRATFPRKPSRTSEACWTTGGGLSKGVLAFRTNCYIILNFLFDFNFLLPCDKVRDFNTKYLCFSLDKDPSGLKVHTSLNQFKTTKTLCLQSRTIIIIITRKTENYQVVRLSRIS